MKIEHINDQLQELFRRCIFENECNSNAVYVYSFSDPDGVRTGKSGWSFGITQIDVNNCPYAMLALKEIGFTTDETAALKRQDSALDMKAMNLKLQSNKTAVDKWDLTQLNDCLESSLKNCQEINIDFSKLETFLHIADYHNQFGFSKGGKLYTYLKGCGIPITPEMIRDFKLSLPWGQKRPDDVQRRFNNIAKICIKG